MHTPGPWRIGDAGFTVFGPKKPDGTLPETIATGKNRGNVRLAATSPELLAALERAIPWLGRMIADKAHMNCVLPRDCEIALDMAEKAVGKAKGEIK